MHSFVPQLFLIILIREANGHKDHNDKLCSDTSLCFMSQFQDTFLGGQNRPMWLFLPSPLSPADVCLCDLVVNYIEKLNLELILLKDCKKGLSVVLIQLRSRLSIVLIQLRSTSSSIALQKVAMAQLRSHPWSEQLELNGINRWS